MEQGSTRAERFLALVHEEVARDRDRSGDAWVEWIAGRVDGDAVVVLSQWVEHRHGRFQLHPVDGRRFVLADLGREVYGDPGRDVRDLAADAALDVLEPDGPGVLLDVPWAMGLVADPARIEWHGDARRSGRPAR